jgi:acyl carrier protein
MGQFTDSTAAKDISFEKIPFEQFQRVLGPKVHGSINLHEATLDLPLDFFIMTSSIVTMVGSATQSAYCAATSFQDSFARWRLSQGRVAQAFAFGLILEVGTAISQPELRKTLIRNGMYGTSEAEFLKLIEASFLPQALGDELSNDPLAKANLITGFEPGKFVDMYAKGWASDYHWTADPRHSNLMQSIEDLALLRLSGKKSDETPDQLKNATPGELKLLVTKMVIERLSKLLFMAKDEIDPEKGVSDYGMDSMIAAELRNWLWKMFSLDISFLDLLDSRMKIRDLAEKAMIKKSATN